MPKNCVYVGRGTVFGNPFTVKEFGTAEACVEYYRHFLMNDGHVIVEDGDRIRNEIFRRLPELKGKDLACWCGNGPCHADVLLQIANMKGAVNDSEEEATEETPNENQQGRRMHYVS